MSQCVRITDVSPRDGLQNEAGFIPTAHKVRLIDLLGKSGLDEIEITSFVSPRWVPQLGDASEVCRLVPLPATRACVYSALVPNPQGVQNAIAAHRARGGVLLGKVSVFTSASETFSIRNTNASIAQTLERFVPVIGDAHAEGLRVRAYISCVVACPFEGAVGPGAVARVARQLAELGVNEIDLGDTIGAATRQSTRDVLHAVRNELGESWWSADRMTLHLHDTFGRAAECVREALDLGVRSFDGSVAGLGGCPYASTPDSRAPGNISTESLVRVVQAAGFVTSVDLDRLESAAAYAREIIAQSRARRG